MLVTIVVIAVLVVVFVVLYNKLVRLRNRVDEAWAQIDVQLRRRYDLIPNLVETVKGYAAHERETLTRVIQARAAAVSVAESPTTTAADQAVAEGALTRALRGLLAVSEQYPNLKANEQFNRLSEELTGTENRIAFARQHYNDSVRQLNTAIETIPYTFVAGVAKATRREYFEVPDDDAARGPVSVQF